MGKLEEESRIRSRRTKFNTAILTVLAVAVAGTLSPSRLVNGVIKELRLPKEKRRAGQNAIYAARGRLMRRGLINYADGNFCLTDAGSRFLATSLMEPFKPTSKKWDKKWRILIFDIGEERRTLRAKVRNTLRSIGFKRLQDSVWVFPYDCEDLIVLLKTDFKIGRDLLYIIADQIEGDERIRKEFGLN